jgi:hypothetical protein
MLGKVHVWKMRVEERLSYIVKHPDKPKEKEDTFANIYEITRKEKK